jgi:hypothetical protein
MKNLREDNQDKPMQVIYSLEVEREIVHCMRALKEWR